MDQPLRLRHPCRVCSDRGGPYDQVYQSYPEYQCRLYRLYPFRRLGHADQGVPLGLIGHSK